MIAAPAASIVALPAGGLRETRGAKNPQMAERIDTYFRFVATWAVSSSLLLSSLVGPKKN
jgi:hypothetical protein